MTGTTTGGSVPGSRLTQLRARILAEPPGTWDGKRALAAYQEIGFNCTIDRARTNLQMAAERFPGLLTPVEGKRHTWTAPGTSRTTIREGTVESRRIEDGAIRAGDVLTDLHHQEPYAVEQVILHALAEFSMGGPPMGKDEARRWLSLYLRQVGEGRSPVDPGVST
ncbi:hypothetical protein ACFCZR_24560 [Streptomyces rubiginosohelvolus]|uniref:hypothetical protein n=1 Tax=Streptomyces rubiginosohelvolus TaxID=67362 RepID=UPI0035E31D22